MSLKLMICSGHQYFSKDNRGDNGPHIFMLQVLQKLQFAICSLGQDRRTEWLHNLLHCDRLSCQLIFGGAENMPSLANLDHSRCGVAVSYQTSPKAPIPTGWRSVYLQSNGNQNNSRARSEDATTTDLLVISKVVPKIWARTNSAMAGVWRKRDAKGD